MSTTEAPEITRALGPEALGPLTHDVCCVSGGHLARCGEDVAENPWLPNDTALTCAECIEADVRNLCPRTGICMVHDD